MVLSSTVLLTPIDTCASNVHRISTTLFGTWLASITGMRTGENKQAGEKRGHKARSVSCGTMQKIALVSFSEQSSNSKLGESKMQKGNSIKAGSGRIGGASVEIKQATMLRLIGSATNLTLQGGKDKEPMVLLDRPGEYQKYTSGQWELHANNTRGFAVDNAQGETLTVLSRTMLVYFLACAGERLTDEARSTLTEKVIGKLVDLGEAGIRASKFDGGFSSASVGAKGFAVLTSLRKVVISKAKEEQQKVLELATAQANVKAGPVQPVQANKGKGVR